MNNTINRDNSGNTYTETIASLTKIKSALGFIDSDCPRDDWWPVGAALKTEFDEDGYALFDEWSSSAPNYSAADCRDTWKSLRAGHINIGTLFKRAYDAGWRWKDDGGSTPPPPRRIQPSQSPEPPPTYQYAQDIWKRYGASCYMEDAWVQTHPYSISKNAGPGSGIARTGPPPLDGVMVQGRLIGYGRDCLIVPMYELEWWNGPLKLVGVQCINDVLGDQNGKQSFGSVGAFMVGDLLDETSPIYVVEGWGDLVGIQYYWSTGEYKPGVCVCCFGLSNQDKIVIKLATAWPNRKVWRVCDAIQKVAA